MTDRIRAILPPAPNPEVVELLRSLLARAEAGEWDFVAFIGVTRDGFATSGWTQSDSLRPLVFVGALEEAKLRFLNAEIAP